MSSVTNIIKETKQPRGGFLPPKRFENTTLESSALLNDMSEENIHALLMGITVDYLTRFMNGTDKNEAFKISLKGAANARETVKAEKILADITGLDSLSIISSCKLSGYDVCYRKGMDFFKNIDEIEPNTATIENIRIMVERSLFFINNYGPITKDGFDFKGAESKRITIGDGDFLTKETLWDFKVSKAAPTSKNTLQLIIYYLMGKKSIHKEFDSIESIGIYNPRLNTVYLLNVSEIEDETINLISTDIIGY